MKQVSLYEAKTSLSALVEEAANGEEIVIAKNGKARAKLVALVSEHPKREMRFGRYDHLGYDLPADFDDPIPELEARLYGPDPA